MSRRTCQLTYRLAAYGGPVVSAAYRDLFAAVAATSGTLTGLLFVALSVTPSQRAGAAGAVIRRFRAAAALQAFTNALAVSLFGLVPETNVGYPSLVLGIIGIMFTAAAIRSVLASKATPHHKFRQLGLVILLLLIYGTELAAGISLLASPSASTPPQMIGYALVASLLVGVARAWELVGEVDTGLIASIATLTGRTRSSGIEEADPDDDYDG
jgi:hypothetical protein